MILMLMKFSTPFSRFSHVRYKKFCKGTESTEITRLSNEVPRGSNTGNYMKEVKGKAIKSKGVFRINVSLRNKNNKRK
jgi:hypothetical protein